MSIIIKFYRISRIAFVEGHQQRMFKLIIISMLDLLCMSKDRKNLTYSERNR